MHVLEFQMLLKMTSSIKPMPLSFDEDILTTEISLVKTECFIDIQLNLQTTLRRYVIITRQQNQSNFGRILFI